MDLFELKLIAAFLTFLMAVIAGWIPFKKRIEMKGRYEWPSAEALACGIFLGAGLIHMLSDSATAFTKQGYQYPFAFLIAGLMFLTMLWLEHFGRELHKTTDTYSSNAFAVLALIMLSIHAFLAGVALGISAQFSLVFIILFAILAHKWAESFSLAIEINRSNLSLITGISSFSIFAIMTPLGIIVGDFVLTQLGQYKLAEPILMSLAAGTFLYLGTLHGLNRAVMVEKCCDLRHFSFVVLGFILMTIVAIWI